MPHVCHGLTHASTFERDPHIPQVCDEGQQHLDRNCEETEGVGIKYIYEKHGKPQVQAFARIRRAFWGLTHSFLALDLGDVVVITGRIFTPILNLIIIDIN